MDKKTIWITGGSTGIGKALAIKFAKEGWNVAISARRENLLKETCGEHENISSFPLDVTDKNKCKEVFQNIVDTFQNVDICFFSTGTWDPKKEKDIDVELAKKVLRNFVKTSSKEITIDAIQKMVCEYFDVPYDKLLHKTRKREIVQARQITMYLAKAFTKNSLKTIGEHFGGRDHTTVIHSCQTVKDLMDTDSIFRENVMELTQKVQLAAM